MRWIAALLLTPFVVLPGCTVCEPQAIDMDVVLDLEAEEVRTLPVLASGDLSVSGIDVPDSHGWLRWNVEFTHSAPSTVDVEDLRLRMEVNGRTLPVIITHADGLGRVHEHGGRLDGTLRDGRDLVLWWTVDRSEAGLDRVVLAAGATYRASLDFDWRLDGCTYSGRGSTDVQESDEVRDSIVSSTFRAKGEPDVNRATGTVAFDADLEVRNGIDTEVRDAMAVDVWLTTGIGAPAVAVWNDPTLRVDGLPITTVTPGQTLTVSGPPTPMAASGDGLHLLVIWLDHRAADGTSGVHHDLFGFAVLDDARIDS